MKSPTKSLSLVAFVATAAAVAGTMLATADAQPSGPQPAGKQAATDGVHLIHLPSAKHFQRHVTNPYFPLEVGSQWIYKGFGADAGERVVVKVLKRTKNINGIKATVVSDRATLNGKLIEMTHDFYAQDDQGRVWYLGEATTSYEDDGSTSTEGSWEAGVDGAKPGIQMFKHGRLNKMYAQEFLKGEAEDQGELLTRRARAVVPTGSYKHVWMTKDTTPLEPEIMELKFYAPGVGLVLEVGTSPDQGRAELVKFTRG